MSIVALVGSFTENDPLASTCTALPHTLQGNVCPLIPVTAAPHDGHVPSTSFRDSHHRNVSTAKTGAIVNNPNRNRNESKMNPIRPVSTSQMRPNHRTAWPGGDWKKRTALPTISTDCLANLSSRWLPSLPVPLLNIATGRWNTADRWSTPLDVDTAPPLTWTFVRLAAAALCVVNEVTPTARLPFQVDGRGVTQNVHCGCVFIALPSPLGTTFLCSDSPHLTQNVDQGIPRHYLTGRPSCRPVVYRGDSSSICGFCKKESITHTDLTFCKLHMYYSKFVLSPNQAYTLWATKSALVSCSSLTANFAEQCTLSKRSRSGVDLDLLQTVCEK